MNKNYRPNILFVCSRNQWRSPTAENLYAADERINVRSRGTSFTSRQRLKEADLRWASLIIVMESKHKSSIISNFPLVELPPVKVLNITDDYQYMDEYLQRLLVSTIEPVLDEFLQSEG